ncbi:MAG: hypothetical protein J2P36_02070 [Ktedonobacteraceae bacterium]|nr:hypothetical protein [Ktedonobacteraceae bacterium]
MAEPIIEAVRRLHITPLVNIQHPGFAHAYAYGLATRLFGNQKGHGPVLDTSLIDQFLDDLHEGHFQHSDDQRPSLNFGFRLGKIHGGVLLPDGSIRPGVTKLVTLHDQEAKRGYGPGREFYFTDADTEEEWYRTDEFVIERLRELAREYHFYQDAERTIRYCIGDILGELSGRLFPWTHEEQRAIEEDSIKHLGYVCRINPRSIAARQFSLQAVS